MSKYALFAGVGLLFFVATGKVVIQAIRVAKLRRASAGQGFHFKGPFEAAMTRREAALILGVRETASEHQVMNSYKKLMMINHPDTGGSTYIATKVNEAKDKMLAK